MSWNRQNELVDGHAPFDVRGEGGCSMCKKALASGKGLAVGIFGF
jgi:hypothetical protein